MKHQEITGQINKTFYNVYNAPRSGFVEKLYENAMFIE